MDPNEALARMRSAVEQVGRMEDDPATFADIDELQAALTELAASVEALDGWLVGGGFLPTSWAAKR